MTQKELEIAQAACCVGTMWDQYEGTEKFNEMVGKRVQHLIELVHNHLEQEKPEELEEEVKKFWNTHALDYRIGRVADLDFMLLCARHFAKWGAIHLNARKEE